MVALISILAAIALPQYKIAIIQAQEATLRENLFRFRDLIDQYQADKGKYPASLEALVQEGYLRQDPRGPHHAGRRLAGRVRGARPRPSGGGPGVFDVKSTSGRRLAGRDALQRMVRHGAAFHGARARPGGGLLLVLLLRLRRAATPTARAEGGEGGELGHGGGPPHRGRSRRSPDNIGYKIALENARIRGQPLPLRRRRSKALAAQDLDKAADELEIAVKYDGGNKSAADDLAIVRKQDPQARRREAAPRRLRGHEGPQRSSSGCPCPCSRRGARSPSP